MKKLYLSPELMVNHYEPTEEITASGIVDAGVNKDPGWGDIID